jgi:hypothetical protein
MTNQIRRLRAGRPKKGRRPISPASATSARCGATNLPGSDVGGRTFSYPLPHDNNNPALRVAAAYDLEATPIVAARIA